MKQSLKVGDQIYITGNMYTHGNPQYEKSVSKVLTITKIEKTKHPQYKNDPTMIKYWTDKTFWYDSEFTIYNEKTKKKIMAMKL